MPTTTYKGLPLPAQGGNSGTWGDDLNNGPFTYLDANLGGISVLSLTGTTYTMSAAESRSLIVRASGALTQNCEITTLCKGLTLVENVTTGGKTVTFTNGVGSPATLPTSGVAAIITDATNGTRIVGSNLSISDLLDTIGSTRGSLLYRGASGWAILAPGASGYALLSSGAGADPYFGAVSGASGGTVTSVSGSGGATGLTLTGGPITGSGTLTLGGTLAIANGGTGATDAASARTNLGAGSVTSVNGAGGATGLTLTGGPITGSGTLTLGGTLAVSSGGSGASSAAGARANFGLGSMATQSSSSVSITGGSISGVSISGFSEFASGTNLVFVQTSAPTGWTKSVSYNDYALRIVSGTASSGGTVAFSSLFSASITNLASHTHTASVTDPGHVHHTSKVGTSGYNTVGGSTTQANSAYSDTASATTGISVSNASTGSGTTTTFALQYVDAIICSKN